MTVPADAVRALIEERERYEAWLDALSARRGATPAHVFDRVQADYDARLRGVRERIAEQVVPLRDAESALARRQDEVVRTLTDRQDELAELELRTLVGEFEAEDGERRVQQTAAVVRELDADRRAVTEQLTELRALLARAGTGATTPGEPGAAEPAAEGAPSAAASEPPPQAEPAVPSPALFVGGTSDGAASPRVDAPAVEPAVEPAPQWRGAKAPAEEEGFVGTGARLDSLAASLGGAVAPPAPPATGGQERTLRCQECGEMNYPTEWYCERCGGELAAL